MAAREREVVTDNEDIENRRRRVEELLQAIDIADEGGNDSQADELEEEATILIGEIEELEAIAVEEEEEEDDDEYDEDGEDEDDEELGVAREAAIRQAIEEEAYLAEMAYIEEEEIRLEEEEAAAEEEEAGRAEEEGAGGGVDPEELHRQVWEGFQNQNPSPQEVEKESLQKYHREMNRMAQEINRKVR